MYDRQFYQDRMQGLFARDKWHLDGLNARLIAGDMKLFVLKLLRIDLKADSALSLLAGLQGLHDRLDDLGILSCTLIMTVTDDLIDSLQQYSNFTIDSQAGRLELVEFQAAVYGELQGKIQTDLKHYRGI